MVDRIVQLSSSPLAPGVTPVTIRCRIIGSRQGGALPLVFLHGAWGYEVYPFDAQIAALAAERQIVIPDRTGYGASTPIDVQLPAFHQRAADETLAVLDALGIEESIVWGHSDGAVTALRLGLAAPHRVCGIISEASHYLRRKPASRDFFETMRDRPDAFGERINAALQRDHGERWRQLMSINGAAWLRLGDEAADDRADLYDGRMTELSVPTLIVHGGRDPRTEPGELEQLLAALDRRGDALRHRSKVMLFADAGHSPHTERSTAAATTDAAREFLHGIASTKSGLAQGVGPASS